MDEYKVTIIMVRDAVGFDPTTLNPIRNKIVTFTVGKHGPFNITFSAANYNPETVNRAIQQEVDTLKAIGATS